MAIKKKQITPRQKMINLMYVILMAMLALNISTEVLNGFSIVEESINRTTANSAEENSALYARFEQQMKTNPENSLEALQLVLPVFQDMTEWSFEAIHDAMIGLAEANGLKNGRIMWPVRVAVSGKPTTPGGAVELCQILGKEETLARIQKGIAQLSPQG